MGEQKAMRSLLSTSFLTLLVCLGDCRVASAASGDVNGDGLLNLADVVHAASGQPASPGSLEEWEVHPCFADWNQPEIRAGMLGGLIYLEELRRSVPDPLPHWIPVFENAPDPVESQPSEEIRLHWNSTWFVARDRVRLEFELEVRVRVDAFSFLVDSEAEILRPAPLYTRFDSWVYISGLGLANMHADGDIPVGVGYGPYLITNGRYVVNYGIDPTHRLNTPLAPGSYRIIVEARVPRGTLSGNYSLHVLESSSFLLEDGTVVSPTLGGDATLTLPEIVDGWDGGVPPLDFDEVNKRVKGGVEFRLSDAKGHPGQSVSVLVQMRTQVPLNYLRFRVLWDNWAVECDPLGSQQKVFINPEDNLPYEPYRSTSPFCVHSSHAAAGFVDSFYTLAGSTLVSPSYANRPLEYFKPLDEWVDLHELTIRIPEGAGGGTEIPLRFLNSLSAVAPFFSIDFYVPFFVPYGIMDWPCSVEDGSGVNWEYDVTWQDGKIRVLGDQEPDPPDVEDAGLRFSLGEGSGAPGDLVDLPIAASLEDRDLGWYRLVLEVDLDILRIESAEFFRTWLDTGEIDSCRVARGEYTQSRRCEDPFDLASCEYASPHNISFRRGSEQFALLELSRDPPGVDVLDYPGEELTHIGNVRLRISDQAPAGDIPVRFSVAPPGAAPIFGPVSSGSYRPWPSTMIFVPATETIDGVVRVVGGQKELIRGDTNSDGEINLTDAIATLLALFQGGENVACEDAADADDSGIINITDAIYLLGSLFLGGPSPPSPHPGCGVDVTADELTCLESSCRGR